MTLKEACEELRDLARGEGRVRFARYYSLPPAPGELTPSALEAKLIDNGIIRFATQEHGHRTYHVMHKRLDAVLQEASE